MNNETSIILIILLGSLLCLMLIPLRKASKKNKHYERRFSKVLDIDKELEKLGSEKSKISRDIEKLRTSYREKRKIFDRLTKEIAIYDEEIEFAELGFYKPHFDFDTSEKYKEELMQIKSKQKDMIKAKTAIYCNQQWTVDGSKAKGRMMTNRGIRMTARAFNNECDSAISSVSWNNALRMEERINKAFDAINKLNESNKILIAQSYHKLKIEELRLTHEYKEKKQTEKEEQAEIRRRMREEAKLEKELERSIKEEERYQRLLEKAKTEAEKASGQKLNDLNEKIRLLNDELRDAHAKSERAKSMAQQTKIGHVYIISNIGSFGEKVYKIGMTRRLDPIDRVKELGDASVPFVFDVHAMIYSEDAPSLENALHKKFDYNRLNLVNSRKEFFNVSLEKIKEEVSRISPDAEFIETAEAREYRETQALIKQRKEKRVSESKLLPIEI